MKKSLIIAAAGLGVVACGFALMIAYAPTPSKPPPTPKPSSTIIDGWHETYGCKGDQYVWKGWTTLNGKTISASSSTRTMERGEAAKLCNPLPAI